MKLGGSHMVQMKETFKSVGIILICFCIAFLETLFFSYSRDLKALDVSALSIEQQALYDAQLSMCLMMHVISFCILGGFGFVLLFFSIERYIEENKQNMGLLKALGYHNKEIAISFSKFAIPTCIGCAAGYLLAIAFSKLFYKEMNGDILPGFTFQFHFDILLLLIFLPTILVLIFSIFIAVLKLRRPPLDMINDLEKNRKSKACKEVNPYLKQLKRTVLKNHKLLVFFEAFSVICFASCIQMSFTMKKQANTSALLFWMMFGIGLLLGITILFLAFKFIYKGNIKYILILKAYGYSNKECRNAFYSSYHVVSLIAFIIGTIYQIGLLSMMFQVFSKTIEIKYRFDWLGFLYSILIFCTVYGFIFVYYHFKIKKMRLDQMNVNID